MRLVVSTPTAVVVDTEVSELRADDATGSFGILPGHADFVTVLPVSVVEWRGPEDGMALVRRGVLSVRDGRRIDIAARSAVREADLDALEARAVAAVTVSGRHEEETRTADARAHLAVIRRLERVLREGHGPVAVPRLRVEADPAGEGG